MVLRLDKNSVPYIEDAYETEKYARQRVDHLASLDKVTAWVQTVRVPYVWKPPEKEPPVTIRVGIVTSGPGQELHDYARDERRRFSLGAAVEGAWGAWRQQQLDAGNFEEAAQDPPVVPPELFEEHGGTLKLHPQDLP